MKKIFSILLLATLLSSCSTEVLEENIPETKQFKTQEVQKKIPERIEAFSAEILPLSEVQISSKTSGKIIEINFEVGAEVKEGEKLIKLGEFGRASELQVAVNSAQMNLAALQKNKESLSISADSNVALADRAVQSAKIAVNSAQKNLDSATESAQKNLEQAETTLANSKNNSGNLGSANQKNIDSLELNLQKQINSHKVNLEKMASETSAILGAEDSTNHLNDSYKTFLGATDRATLNTADFAFKQANSSVKNLTQNPNIDEILASSEKIKTLLDATYGVLNSSITGANFTSSDLANLRNQIAGYKNELSSGLAQIEGAEAEIESQKGGNNLSINQAQDAVSSSEKNIEAVKAQNNQLIISAENVLEMAKSSLSSAESQYKNSLSAKDLQISSIDTQIAMAKGNVSGISSAQQNESIFSPISGTITAKNVEKGEVISAGQVLASVADLTSLKMQAEIPESVAQKLSVGFKISLEISGKKQDIFISKIEPSSNILSKKVLIEAIVDNSDKFLKSGTFARIEIPFSTENSEEMILIPFSEVSFEYRKAFVFVEKNGVLEKREVKIGEIYGDDVEILSGLSLGEKLFISNGK